jgi:uncharacterized protein YoxC
MNMRRTSDRMAEFFRNTEANLNGTLSELRDTLENMKKITGNVNEVTEDVRQIADTAASVERSIRGLYFSAKEGLGTAAEARIAGLKAGIRTGVVTLVKNLQEGRSDDHERRTGEEGE